MIARRRLGVVQQQTILMGIAALLAVVLLSVSMFFGASEFDVTSFGSDAAGEPEQCVDQKPKRQIGARTEGSSANRAAATARSVQVEMPLVIAVGVRAKHGSEHTAGAFVQLSQNSTLSVVPPVLDRDLCSVL